MKRVAIVFFLALGLLTSVAGGGLAWAGSDEATGPDSVQSP
jgi:hypothetical protein